LNEEVRNASSATGTSQRNPESTQPPADAPRYAVGAHIENHPQVTDLVPRRYRVVGLSVMFGAMVAVTAETIAHHAASLSKLTSVISAAEITSLFADRFVAWSTATMLLVLAAYAKLIFLLRRHRVDDYRGRYRVWRIAVWTALALSLHAVVGGHTIAARALGHFSGWNLLPNNAAWWLAPTAIFGGWLLVKLALDVAECRSALTAYVLAMGCFVAAGVALAGWLPAGLAAWTETLGRSLPLAGYTLLLAGTLLFARYVVLDVQGLIQHSARRKSSTLNSATASIENAGAPLTSRSASKSNLTTSGQTMVASIGSAETGWVNGSESGSDNSTDVKRRLSKAERKRLRKQKMRNRAA